MGVRTDTVGVHYTVIIYSSSEATFNGYKVKITAEKGVNLL